MKLATFFRVTLPCALALGGVMFAGHQALDAADHFDPPARTGSDTNTAGFDIAADIADLYAFHDANNVYLSIGFGGP